jgi:hypothetical protein
MQVEDSFFVGRVGWAEQLLYAVQVIEKANREFRHPNIINGELIEQSVTWNVADDQVNIQVDCYSVPQLLVNRVTQAKRVRAYTPTRAIDVGIDRDLTTVYSGVPVQPDLMTTKGIDTLEERTAYLLQAKTVHDKMIIEWNFFAEMQENLWLKIYRDEGLLSFSGVASPPTSAYYFSSVGGFAGGDGTLLYGEVPAFIRGVTRASYFSAITQWLLDSGTTARSGGVAVDNDSYIVWLADQISNLSANSTAVAKRPIDPRYIYRFRPLASTSGNSASGGGGTGDGGTAGAPDSGSPDPANENASQNLLEELANRESPLTAELGGGLSTAPINTLPEC